MALKDLTQLLNELDTGNGQAPSQLLKAVYAELRALASKKIKREAVGYTLQGTELVHEAWLRVSKDKNRQWKDSTHFYAAAAEAMRRILIDRARRKQRVRHGGELQRADPEALDIAVAADESELLAIHDALSAYELVEPKKAQVVKLKFFVGLNLPEIAAALNISYSTAERYWLFSKAWLFDYLKQEQSATKKQ